MNKTEKKIFIILLIIPIILNLIIAIVTVFQYKNIKQQTNYTIASIIEEVEKSYPNIDSEDIMKILNNENPEEGLQELTRYGIDIQNISSIAIIEKTMYNNIILNISIILIFNILYIIIFYTYFKNRHKKINELTKYINEISNRNYELMISDNTEDELTHLRNDLYKITVLLKEEAEKSKTDKQKLKVSLEDISHQLKTPLTSISIILDNLKENPDMEPEMRKKFIYKINREIDGINFLVISLLKLSKLDAKTVEFQNEKINVKKLIDDSIKKLEIPIEIKKSEIIINGNSNVEFKGDYNWQLEAITNIIKNCIEHSKDGQKIFIDFMSNSLYTKIKIKDEGEGIPKEDIKHIFERFYKGKNSSNQSFGIGLALAKSIIENNNGYIKCNSKINQGTEFLIKYMK